MLWHHGTIQLVVNVAWFEADLNPGDPSIVTTISSLPNSRAVDKNLSANGAPFGVETVWTLVIWENGGICTWFWLLYFDGIFFGVETQAHYKQLCSGIRIHFNRTRNVVWLAVELNPDNLTQWQQSPRAKARWPPYPGPRFNIKMTSYQYRKSHCRDKTILRPSNLHNGISYTGKMTSLYWIGPQNATEHGANIHIRMSHFTGWGRFEH